MNQIDRYTCEQVFRRLDDYLDRELDPLEMLLVREHLEVCAACAAEYRFQSSVINEVRTKLQRIAVPSDLLAKVSNVLEKARNGAEG